MSFQARFSGVISATYNAEAPPFSAADCYDAVLMAQQFIQPTAPDWREQVGTRISPLRFGT
jgi:hypothetical protein